MQALQGDDITIYGDGSQTRSFCYVDDLINAFIALMATGDDVTGPINTGNPGEFTMLELAQEVIAITNSKSKIIHQPLPQDDPKQRRPDITKAKKHLNWEPKVQLKEGLTRTVAYFDDLIRKSKTA
jgi:UDP-glucuronate decarboxylase